MNTSYRDLAGWKPRIFKLSTVGSVLWMFLIYSLATPTHSWAQPSDAQIVKDLKSPGVLSVTLSQKGGGKVWSRTDLQYYWERGAVVTRKADVPGMPEVELEIGGLATYSIVGGKYVFKKFYVTWNEYKGIPKPTEKEIMALIDTDRSKFFGYAYNRIVGEVEKLKLADDPKWTWHTPNSVSFNMVVVAPQIINNTEVARVQQIYEVRLYRDKVKDPWKNFISSPGQGDDRKELSKKTYTADEIKAMKTLDLIESEKDANAALNKLPKVTIPSFKSDVEIMQYTHKMLRDASAGELESYLMQVLAPGYFVEGSTVLLTQRGTELINKAVHAAYKGKSTYKAQYCPDPKIKHYQQNMVEFQNNSIPTQTRIAVGLYGGTFQEGVKVGQVYKIQDLEVWVSNKQEDIDRLNSFSPGKLCAAGPNEQTLATLIAKAGGTGVGGTGTPQPVTGNAPITGNALTPNPALAEPITWTPHTATNARLKVSFPATPKETEGKMNNKYPMYTLEAEHPSALYRVVSVIYPTKLNRQQATQVITSAAQSFIQNNRARIVSQSDYATGTLGKLYTLDRDGNPIKYRLYVIDDVLYQLIMSADKAAFTTDNERAFFDSFEATQ